METLGMRIFITIMADALGDDATLVDRRIYGDDLSHALADEFPGAEIVISHSGDCGWDRGPVVVLNDINIDPLPLVERIRHIEESLWTRG